MVRTKLTGKPKANGTIQKPPKEPEPIKSPAQPQELSDGDRQNLKIWLDKQEKPFGVTTAPASRKRKRSSGLQVQSDLFEDRLSIQYEVKPRDKWECLRRYKKFTVGSESIAVGQCILVKHDDSEDGARIDLAEQWKAKVLEVRALDTEHVYIRVAWLNRPEDLPSGRNSYHGKNELIPTNEMEVIDAMAVNGSFEIIHWDEKDEDVDLMNDEEFFWRQTYDFANTKKFTDLRKICVDTAPINPDEMILQCGNSECKKWQHVKCIAEAAVQLAVDEASETKKSPKKARTKDVTIGSRSRAQAKAQTDSFTAEVFIADMPKGDDIAPATKTEIVITSAEGESHSLDVSCLFCGKEIE